MCSKISARIMFVYCNGEQYIYITLVYGVFFEEDKSKLGQLK